MPNPGWVELEPQELWEKTISVMKRAIQGEFLLLPMLGESEYSDVVLRRYLATRGSTG